MNTIQTKKIEVFGKHYILSKDEIEKYASLTELFKEEENFVLDLKIKFGLDVREDLLILFIHMYLHRYAIPYFQLMHESFPSIENKFFLQEILYYCMIGRAVDDIVDNDSQMFKKYESVLIADVYSEKLKNIISAKKYDMFRLYLVESAKYESKLNKKELSFEELEEDVFIRIKYFFLLSEDYNIKNQKWLSQYVGILLSGLDLNDSIADGYLKESSTVISNNLYYKFINDEGKILLDGSLIKYYTDLKQIINKNKIELENELNLNALYYTSNILNKL